ncbi:nucleotide sugar dehydrogenase [Clostridium sp. YIM B02505]|uniref:Nucleotide sugar dehydrogenase n=1 Tax=Clostridium yunnanense TaxID=2800325 RepID=A0ABS1ETP3_9CLOT|nr:nucleotide sugar dehydrogenase [Clostridium yunnanense]MBK1812710.1 nucleotide sugar dehydrogenase [Clostridium yunnanense]
MNLYKDIIAGKEKISVVGLGYVGIQLAVEFGKKVSVIGFDINNKKIQDYKKGIDPTNEVHKEDLGKANILFTNDETLLQKAKFHIVAVPTPVNRDKTPDLVPMKSATEAVARNLNEGSVIVYESTVYPGLVEEVCIPILERESGLKCGVDFKVGYSPERITPGDKSHSIINVVKIISGIDEEALDLIAKVYNIIIADENIYRAESIKVAEAAKVTENTQRDLIIALMNELSIIFNKMEIDTKAVLRAAATKWNFISMNPGIVGGHCIGVDPYYLAYKAEEIGYHPQLILAGRRINDGTSKFIAENTIKQLIKAQKQIRGCKILVVGFSYKEDVPDIRNTKVVDIINELREYGAEIQVADYIVDQDEVFEEYGLKISDFEKANNIDAVIYAVPHQQYRDTPLEKLKKVFKDGNGILIDIKGNYHKSEAENNGLLYWSL